MEIRGGTEPDLEQVNRIYNHYVRTSAATFDLDETDMDYRRDWFAGFGGRYRFLVAEQGGVIAGYATTMPLSERRAYEVSAMSSVYLDERYRGRGIGSALYGALFDAVADEDLHRLYAGITVPNPASVALHERFGFKQVAYFSEQGRKFDRYWDVTWFEKAL